MKKNSNIKLRYNIVTTIIYMVGVILLIQLFNLQIVHGEEYRETSNTRLTRESTLEAQRGNIRDQSGNILAGTVSGVDVELYKTKIDTETLNSTLLKFAQLLETNGDKYKDDLPISINPFAFTISEESQNTWKANNNIEQGKTAEECFYILKEKYQISNENVEECRKIMTLRYVIAKNGYSNTRPVQIATNISQNTLAQLNEQNDSFPGISIPINPTRNYPSGSLASHILGYIGRVEENDLKGKEDIYDPNDIIGRTGIEYIFEPYLKGKNGIKQIDMAVDGTVTSEYVSQEAIAGSDVILTIDANLQQVTENALEANINKIATGGFSDRFDANAGSAVVLNVNTGEVLAMASYPDFEPGQFVNGISQAKYDEYNSEAAHSPLFNRAIQSISSPGSTFKMVTAIAGLETGAITPTEKINDVGTYRYYKDYTPHCWNRSGHGYLNVSQAIVRSCNYFFYETGRRVGIDNLKKYANYLGLGKKTGVELLGEEAGYVASKETSELFHNLWTDGLTLVAAIGQGDNSFTTLQMAKYTSMIANGGKNLNVTIIKSIVDASGNEVPKQEIQNFVDQRLNRQRDEMEQLPFKPETIQAVKEGMKGVTTESGGTAASVFRGFNIEVGGKTGSAEAGNKTNAWFVGFAPFDNPEIAVVVMVENGGHGSYTAEVARDIIAEYFGMNANKITEDMTAIPMIELNY